MGVRPATGSNRKQNKRNRSDTHRRDGDWYLHVAMLKHGHHLWAFRHLYEYVAYNSKEQGVGAVQVGLQNTSNRCLTCGFTHDDNRYGEDFECLVCGYQSHADYNAAKNIGLQFSGVGKTKTTEAHP